MMKMTTPSVNKSSVNASVSSVKLLIVLSTFRNKKFSNNNSKTK